MIIKTQVPLQQLLSFQPAGELPELKVFEHLEELTTYLKTSPQFRVLGKGSNTVIDPTAIQEDIIQIHADMTAPVIDGNSVTVSAGTPLTRLLSLCQKQGLSGLEFAAGVPASVGGMVAMNFGCWGFEVCQFCTAVRVIKPGCDPEWLSAQEMAWSYRSSILLSQPWVAIEAKFLLIPEDPAVIQETLKNRIQTRLEKQPLRGKTFGSVFKNPEGHFAGALIEKMGLKGKSFGSVKWSEKHANFLENEGPGRYQDVVLAIQTTQQKVLSETGVSLQTEVQLWPEMSH
jgi:UDP-N-acetylmuramate dehydrogenase